MEYPPETRAAVLAAVATGQSVNSIAKQYGISRAAIIRWRDTTQLPGPSTVQQQKRRELGEQLFTYLQESIVTLEFLVKFARNEAWLEKQSAADVAVLYGVLTDKSVRLLGALQNGPDSDVGMDATSQSDPAGR